MKGIKEQQTKAGLNFNKQRHPISAIPNRAVALTPGYICAARILFAENAIGIVK